MSGFSCVYKFISITDISPITYDRMVDSVTSSKMPAINIQTGVFTAATSGTYLVDWSFITADDSDEGRNILYLHKNQNKTRSVSANDMFDQIILNLYTRMLSLLFSKKFCE